MPHFALGPHADAAIAVQRCFRAHRILVEALRVSCSVSAASRRGSPSGRQVPSGCRGSVKRSRPPFPCLCRSLTSSTRAAPTCRRRAAGLGFLSCGTALPVSSFVRLLHFPCCPLAGRAR